MTYRAPLFRGCAGRSGAAEAVRGQRGLDLGAVVVRVPGRAKARTGYSCGWLMFTSQETPNPSTHMPNSSPQACFCIGMVAVPLADSFSQ
jgi:hypothetical protein